MKGSHKEGISVNKDKNLIKYKREQQKKCIEGFTSFFLDVKAIYYIYTHIHTHIQLIFNCKIYIIDA